MRYVILPITVQSQREMVKKRARKAYCQMLVLRYVTQIAS